MQEYVYQIRRLKRKNSCHNRRAIKIRTNGLKGKQTLRPGTLMIWETRRHRMFTPHYFQLYAIWNTFQKLILNLDVYFEFEWLLIKVQRWKTKINSTSKKNINKDIHPRSSTVSRSSMLSKKRTRIRKHSPLKPRMTEATISFVRAS